jgi:hypothetical protein
VIMGLSQTESRDRLQCSYVSFCVVSLEYESFASILFPIKKIATREMIIILNDSFLYIIELNNRLRTSHSLWRESSAVPFY